MSASSFIADPELVALLADDPELLAIADVIAATQPVPLAPSLRFGSRPVRVVVGAAVGALAAATCASVLALGKNPLDLFRGSPPSAPVQASFDATKQMASAAGAELRARFGSTLLPSLDLARVHGVMSVQTEDGPLYLWSAPSKTVDGGRCWLIQVGGTPDSPDPRHPFGPGACQTEPVAPGEISWSHHPRPGLPSISLLYGELSTDAASVDVHFADGSSQQLPVVEGFFLTATGRDATVTSVTAYDASGVEVGRSTDGNLLAPFTTLDPAGLQYAGWTLTETDSVAPAGSKVATSAEAAHIASAEMHATALETRFVHCEKFGGVPAFSRDCWVVSLDPSRFHSHGPVGSTPTQAAWALVIIDPVSGQVLARKAGTPPQGPR